MLYEAKVLGASAVLLICSILSERQIQEYIGICDEMGISALVEAHDEKEVTMAVRAGARLIGINNRNLGTFFTDVENSFRLAGQLPQDAVLVSESGISDPQTVKRLQTAGFRGFLIGETFMRTTQPGNTLGNFLQAIQ